MNGAIIQNKEEKDGSTEYAVEDGLVASEPAAQAEAAEEEEEETENAAA